MSEQQLGIEWQHVGTTNDFLLDPEWILVLNDREVASFLEMIGITKDHPDFEQASNVLFIKVDGIKVDTILSIQSNKPWELNAPVYQIR